MTPNVKRKARKANQYKQTMTSGPKYKLSTQTLVNQYMHTLLVPKLLTFFKLV